MLMFVRTCWPCCCAGCWLLPASSTEELCTLAPARRALTVRLHLLADAGPGRPRLSAGQRRQQDGLHQRHLPRAGWQREG
jgi:hypothetical protein